MNFNDMVLRKDELEGKISFWESLESEQHFQLAKEARKEAASLEKKIKDHWEKEKQEELSRKKADLKRIKIEQKNKLKEKEEAKKDLDKILNSKEYQEIKDQYKAMEKEIDRLKHITSGRFNIPIDSLNNREIGYLEKEIAELEKETMPEISVLADNIRANKIMQPKVQTNRFV